MKKLIYLIIVILALGLIVSGCLPVVPPAEEDETTSLTKVKPANINNGPNPGTDFNGAHFNLNLIGKKVDWNGGGSYSNWNRHTMFVPECTDGWTTPMGDGLTIWMTQGDEFAVKDGNAFDDDGECRFQLAPGYYKVYIAAKAKPNKTTDITSYGWVDEGSGYYYLELGKVSVTHKKKPVWKDATKLFMYGNDWIFDVISAYPAGVQETAYFWKYVSGGGKLVQVRFYKVSKEDL